MNLYMQMLSPSGDYIVNYFVYIHGDKEYNIPLVKQIRVRLKYFKLFYNQIYKICIIYIYFLYIFSYM